MYVTKLTMKIYSILLLIVIGLLNFSCKKDITAVPIPPECADTISYSNTVQPLIDENCTTSGCHDASSAGGYTFMTYTDVNTNADAIYSAIKHEGIFTDMPLGSPKLTDSLIQQVNCWIAQGKLEN